MTAGTQDLGDYQFRVVNNDYATGGNASSYVMFLDANMSGSTTFTSNRNQAGLRLDFDSSITGHSSTDTERLSSYSIYATTTGSEGSYINYGIRSQSNSAKKVGTSANSVYGGHFTAQGYPTNGNIGGNTNIYGAYNTAQMGGTGTVGSVIGAYGKAQMTTNGDGTKSPTNFVGVFAECEVDEGTVDYAYAFYGVMERDGGTLTNGVLYGGENTHPAGGTNSWQGTIGTKWGIKISGDQKNSLGGDLDIGGDIETSTASKGLILKSPNGTRYRVTVDNSGNLTTTAV